MDLGFVLVSQYPESQDLADVAPLGDSTIQFLIGR
jgi:hypothetical protein